MEFQSLIKVILDIVFPPICIACKKHLGSPAEKRGFLCYGCEKQIVIATSFFCPFCKRRLVNSSLCPTCKNRKDVGFKFIVAAAADYKNPVVQEIIRTLKYQKVRGAIEPIRLIIDRYLSNLDNQRLMVKGQWSMVKGWAIVPLPLHRTKERKRGFNQTFLIAETLRQCLEILEIRSPEEIVSPKIETEILLKTRDAKSQTKAKDYEERKEFVKDSFKIKYPERIKGKNIILVDDIYTSGATMKEAVRVLKTAGAEKVIGFVVART